MDQAVAHSCHGAPLDLRGVRPDGACLGNNTRPHVACNALLGSYGSSGVAIRQGGFFRFAPAQ
jgi:hypothetical protein